MRMSRMGVVVLPMLAVCVTGCLTPPPRKPDLVLPGGRGIVWENTEREDMKGHIRDLAACVEKLTADAGRATVLEAKNRDLEAALDSEKLAVLRTREELRGVQDDLRVTARALGDTRSSLTECARTASVLHEKCLSLEDVIAHLTMDKVHVVQAGENLWSIAGRPEYYGNAFAWPRILAANRELLKGNPNYIRPRWRLTIPMDKADLVRSAQPPAAPPAAAPAAQAVPAPPPQSTEPAAGVEQPDQAVPGESPAPGKDAKKPQDAPGARSDQESR